MPKSDVKGDQNFMRNSARRRSRLRSSQPLIERWKPSPSVAIVVVGLVLGLALGFRGRFNNQTNQVQQDYMLLLSDLYYQGTPLAAVRDRLLKIGFADASLAVVQTADQLSSSPDKIQQQEADQLHQFGEALARGADRNAPPPVVAKPTAAAQPGVTTADVPTAVTQPAPSVVTTPVPIPTNIPTVVAPPSPVSTPPATAP